MKIGDIDFPDDLLDILRNEDSNFVVFAGAGVSRGAPACLPDFQGLAEEIGEQADKIYPSNKKPEVFLDELEREGIDVHDLAREILCARKPQPTSLHKDLLRLFGKPGRVRLVTTNFDTLFTEAFKSVFAEQPLRIYTAPALPLGEQFKGIVHVHGSIEEHENMVLTLKDFGKAYMRHVGWARSFVFELLSNYPILFIGYSYNDTLMRYLMPVVPKENHKRFVLLPEYKGKEEGDRWSDAGVKVIFYPSENEKDHATLCEGIKELANNRDRGAVGWNAEIRKIAVAAPPDEKDKETADRLKEGFKRGYIHFFTKAATSHEWIDWLDKRGYFKALFHNEPLDKNMRYLSRWLIDNFALEHADKLFQLIARHNHDRQGIAYLNPDFVLIIGRFIAQERENISERDKETLSCWISVFFAACEANSDINLVITRRFILEGVVEICIKYSFVGHLLHIFDIMTAAHLSFREGMGIFNPEQKIYVELGFVERDGIWTANKLWQEGLKPRLNKKLVIHLLARIVSRFEDQQAMMTPWGKHYEMGRGRSAIEKHEQDENENGVLHTIIDVARDCLAHLMQHQTEEAESWCQQLIESEVELLRRLAIHAYFQHPSTPANDKLDWLLKHIKLHDHVAKHEIFWAVKQAYPDLDDAHRRALIQSIHAYQIDKNNVPDEQKRKRYEAGYRYDWFEWLSRSDSKCLLVKKELDDILAQHPNFKPLEHPDFYFYSGPVQVQMTLGNAPLLSVRNMLAKQPRAWFQEWKKYLQKKDKIHPFIEERDCFISVSEVVGKDFDWGKGLAQVLARDKAWDSKIWKGVLSGWRETAPALDEKQWRVVFNWLDKSELHESHRYYIAQILHEYTINHEKPYIVKFLPRANKIAKKLWRYAEHEEVDKIDNLYQSGSLNMTSGRLAHFWVSSLWLWRREQQPVTKTLDKDYRDALTTLIEDTTLAGRCAQSVLAADLAFMYGADKKWTEQNLLTLFEKRGNGQAFQAVWDGFLFKKKLYVNVKEICEDLFMQGIPHIHDLGSQKESFVELYTWMIVYYLKGEAQKNWLNKLEKCGDEKVWQSFYFRLRHHLFNAQEGQQCSWWQGWLKSHWSSRTSKSFKSAEVKGILSCLPFFKGDLFAEVVRLVIKRDIVASPLEHHDLTYNLREQGFAQQVPNVVVDLLLYLDKRQESLTHLSDLDDLVKDLAAVKDKLSDERRVRMQDFILKHDISNVDFS